MLRLRRYGFLHLTSAMTPSGEELARLRDTAEQRRKETLRRSIVIDLDAPTTLDEICSNLNAGAKCYCAVVG